MGKTSIFNILPTLPNIPKNKHEKKNKQKNTFCHVQKQSIIFHEFSIFFNIQFCIAIAVFVENI